ncbi:MAG: hypothetical protein Q8M57_13150 [Nitrosomonas sp.]|mgnify:FL=1|uniref:hypothetical protein n=1 Tax=Nitrosomonas sp. TaxID=42353 RepID=UPI0027325BC4|nr:hypothetical protein [Nitrosomonas sp.]MDP3281969.1 hypothetical protein [Nitrosomonas sp.]
MILPMQFPFDHIKEIDCLIFLEPSVIIQIETEQRLISTRKELIRIFEDKIKAVINRVWGEAL